MFVNWGYSSGAGDWQAGETRVLKVIGLREGGDGEQADCNAADLSILIRIQGPEALAQVWQQQLAVDGSGRVPLSTVP